MPSGSREESAHDELGAVGEVGKKKLVASFCHFCFLFLFSLCLIKSYISFKALELD